MSNGIDQKAHEIISNNMDIPVSKWDINDIEELAEVLQHELYDRNEALMKWAAQRDLPV